MYEVTVILVCESVEAGCVRNDVGKWKHRGRGLQLDVHLTMADCDLMSVDEGYCQGSPRVRMQDERLSSALVVNPCTWMIEHHLSTCAQSFSVQMSLHMLSWAGHRGREDGLSRQSRQSYGVLAFR